MDAELADLIEKVHRSPRKVMMVVTGGGSRAIADLLGVAGASRTLLEARVPYAARALCEFLGSEPEHYCSAATARSMAVQAYLRALQLRNGEEPVAGVGCTASLASDRPKRGPHRLHVAVHDHRAVTTWSLELSKGRRDRAGEEEVAGRLVLQAVLRGCGLEDEVPLPLVVAERVEVVHTEAPELLQQLFAGRCQQVTVTPDGEMHADGGPVRAALPGAFDPLHDGHRELASVAGDLLGRTVVFELSITNVDKPPLDFTDVERRLEQFAGRFSVVLTRAPRFLEKARQMPGCTFVVGVDTAERIVAPRYYGQSEEKMRAALTEMASLDCRFLVAGRLVDGRWKTLDDVAVPGEFCDRFDAIPENRFRHDISSTEIRARLRN